MWCDVAEEIDTRYNSFLLGCGQTENHLIERHNLPFSIVSKSCVIKFCYIKIPLLYLSPPSLVSNIPTMDERTCATKRCCDVMWHVTCSRASSIQAVSKVTGQTWQVTCLYNVALLWLFGADYVPVGVAFPVRAVKAKDENLKSFVRVRTEKRQNEGNLWRIHGLHD